jgi:hypothetical protein
VASYADEARFWLNQGRRRDRAVEKN